MKYNKENGFSLLEMAITLIVGGLVYAAVFTAYQIKIKQDKLEEVYEQMRDLRTALTIYVSSEGRYPCPADRTLAPGQVSHGLENCNPVTAITADTGRDANGDTVNDLVMIGTIPYEEIVSKVTVPLTISDIVDPWGNKFTYAVTDTLTMTSSFNNAWGALDVVDEYNRSITKPNERAHFVLLSHGANGRGAFSAAGKRVENCVLLALPGPPPPPPTILSELENCDEDDGDFLSALLNTSRDNEYYDDIIQYQINLQTSLWAHTMPLPPPVPGANPIYRIRNTNTGNVGVGIETPDEQLHVTGNISATNAMQANQLCDELGLDCMDVEFITGPEVPGYNGCTNPTDAIIRIENNTVTCAPAFPAPVTGASCPNPGEYIVGLRSDGSVICDTL